MTRAAAGLMLLLFSMCFAQPDCEFPYDLSDMGDAVRCNYLTLRNSPAHGLSGVAWLGTEIDSETQPEVFDQDESDDGVTFLNLPWQPCDSGYISVTVTGGPHYASYAECGGALYLSAWMDGNFDGDYCDTLCDGLHPEWLIQDEVVAPGIYTYVFALPGSLDLPIHDGPMRFRLMSRAAGPRGFGVRDTVVCPESGCGGELGQDFLGEVEDYFLEDATPGVDLASFEGHIVELGIELEWVTVFQAGIDHFEIVRDLAIVGAVMSQGNGNDRHTYSFTESGIAGAESEYTLFSVDIDGYRERLATIRPLDSDTRVLPSIAGYKLHSNYPNPFNPSTQIAFELPRTSRVLLKIYNVDGQEVASLLNGTIPAGSHTVTFDGSDLPSGVYICRLDAGGFSASTKMLLLK